MKNALFLCIGLVLFMACSASKKGIESVTEESANPSPIEQLVSVAQKDTTNEQALLKVADAYAKNNQDDEANIWYDKALKNEPENVAASLGKAEILLRAGKKRDGYGLYLKALMLDKESKIVPQIAMKLGQPFVIEQITHTNADNGAPSFSPDGKMLAFQSDRDGNMEIYLLDIATNYEKRLTNHPARDEFPKFSPKGKVIVFASTRDDTLSNSNMKLREIYITDIDGQKLARVTANDADDWYPSFNAKGEQVLFVSTSGDIRNIQYHKQWSDIYVHDVKKQETVRLTEDKYQIGTPAYSQDNNFVLFNSNKEDFFHLYKMDAQGTNPVQLTFGQANDAGAQFSPDGKHIVFFSDRAGNNDILMMNSDGSGLTQLTNTSADEVYPIFSPDGKKIAFHSKKDQFLQIFWIDLEKPLGREELIKTLETHMEDIAAEH